MRSIASGVVVHVPINKTSIQQRIQLAAILRRQCITRTQRSEDLLERFTRLTVCGGEIFTQMPEQQQIQEKLSLGATPKQASAILIRDSIRAALIPTVDSAKTVGLVSLPGMMSGLIFAGIDPVKAIKYQIMVTFMLLSTASLSTIIACYLTYRKFYNSRHQLVVTQLKKK